MKVLAIILAVLSLSTFAQEGSGFRSEREGGGGTIISAYFVSYGQEALELLQPVIPDITIEDIRIAVKDTNVFDVADICYQDVTTGDRMCLDAQNNSKTNTISFSRENWKNVSCRERLVLAAHEYLRVIGVEGSDYTYSSKLLTQEVYEESQNLSRQHAVNYNLEVRASIRNFCRDVAR